MMNLKFKWEPGDIAIVESSGRGGKSTYYIIRGTTSLTDNKRYPAYLATKFGISANNKFVGYHTKAFQNRRDRHFENDLWFEGMQSRYIWETRKVDPESLKGAKRQAYEAALQDTKLLYQDYYESQIKFIFIEAARK